MASRQTTSPPETIGEPVREPYVVVWWEGETRQHRVLADEISAGRERAVLKARTRTMEQTSLEPIRTMSLKVFEQMEQLKTDHVERTCPHRPRLLRLCAQCLEGMIPHAS